MKKEDAYKLGVGQTQFRKRFKLRKRIRKARQFVSWSLTLLALSTGLFFVCVHVSKCQDTGMSGTIGMGDVVLTNRLAFALREPERGEIITCRIKDSSGVEKICQRRVIAYPGESIEVCNGNISVNGRMCVESYAKGPSTSDFSIITVPPGCYYVLCDVRSTGPDSRDGIYILPAAVKGAVIQNFPIMSLDELFRAAYDKFLQGIK